MKTAVEWLAERCGLQALEDVIAEAKEIEKKQTIEFAWTYSDWSFSDIEKEFNETFKQEQ